MDIVNMKKYLRLVFHHVVQSVNPKTLIKKSLKVKHNILTWNKDSFPVHKNYYVIGFGKAVYEMCHEVLSVLNNNIKQGVLSVPISTFIEENPVFKKNNIKIYQGAANNIPDNNCLEATKDIIELVKSLKVTDVVIVLISGGGSALFTYPIPPIKLEDKVEVTKLLSKAGSNIEELNCVRKHLSLVKGGKLAQLIYPAKSLSLILSDVIRDNLNYIASGPTVLNINSNKDAISILKKFSLLNKVPKSILTVLEKENEEKIPNEIFKQAYIKIIGSNSIALKSANEYLSNDGKINFILSSSVEGNVNVVAIALCKFTKYICQLLINEINFETCKELIYKLVKDLSLNEEELIHLMENMKKNFININELYFLLGGETTVNVIGKGKGGRNMELVLRYSYMINDILGKISNKFNIFFLSAGTDGFDGPTDAAGAITYNEQYSDSLKQGLNMNDFLEDNNSYYFYKNFKKGEDLIVTGLTGTNVMDIMILCIKKKY